MGRDDGTDQRPRAATGARPRHLAGMTPGRHGMPGGKGPALTTEAVGDPDASSEESAAEGGAAAGAVIGAALAGPIGMAIGAAAGGVTGAAAGPDEPAKRHGDGRVDSRRNREAAYESAPAPNQRGQAPAITRDAVREEHAADIDVIDALTGHGEPEAERPRRTMSSGGNGLEQADRRRPPAR
jgi:hypothetical protein